jgi:hypothetical protein
MLVHNILSFPSVTIRLKTALCTFICVHVTIILTSVYDDGIFLLTEEWELGGSVLKLSEENNYLN